MAIEVPQEESSGSGDWLNTYADMVTLLMTFFVLLYSMATPDAQKWNALVEAFGTGQDPTPGIDSGENPQITIPTDPDELKFDSIHEMIQEYIEANNLEEQLGVEKSDNFVLIRFKDNALFKSGQAFIPEESQYLLKDISAIINLVDDEIEGISIEGHTDNVPIKTLNFPSNWELAGARATYVARTMMTQYEIDESKISYTSFGEYHPIASNDTDEGRAQNRRVEIRVTRHVGPSGLIL